MIINQLNDLISKCSQELIIIAPFIKINALQHILGGITNQKIICVTRWLPDDIISGVSDLEVYEYLSNNENATIYINDALHAKYFRGDNKILIGSANITSKALGIADNSNIELLIETEINPILLSFEKELIDNSILVTDLIYKSYYHIFSQIMKKIDLRKKVTWFPLFNYPNEIYTKLTEINSSKLTRDQKEYLQHDLDKLGITKKNLTFNSKHDFDEYMQISLLNNEVFIHLFSIIRYETNLDRICKLLNKKFNSYTKYYNFTGCKIILNWAIEFFNLEIGKNKFDEDYFVL